jgi:ribosomal protein S27E
MSTPDRFVIDSSDQGAASCVVCGNDIAAGSGVTAQFHGRTLRFKCPGCLSRFAVDSDHYLTEGPSSCCDGEGHAVSAQSAAPSEWIT